MRIAIDRIPDVLRCTPHFERLLTLCAPLDAYLVGGALRDALLGHSITDLDLICPQDPTPLARAFARQIGGHWFWLDQSRLQSRVVVNHDDNCPSYDFAVFRAPTLEQDLLDRDFTINALALPMKADLSAAALVDPRCGVDALRHASLRMVGRDSLANDPLRIIKGIRHATVIGLEVDAETLQCMRNEASGLERVAAERIRQEIWKILADKQAARGLELLIACGAGKSLFGTALVETCHALTARLEDCRQRWRQCIEIHPQLRCWLSEGVEQGLNAEVLLLFAALMNLVDKDLPVRMAIKWKLSRNATAGVAAISTLDADVLKEFAAIAGSQRAFAWWASRLNCDPKLLLLALISHPGADAVTAKVDELIPLVATLDERRPSDLVDGHWLRNELRLEDGPVMTAALELLRTAEIYGEVTNRDEACRFLARHFQNRD